MSDVDLVRSAPEDLFGVEVRQDGGTRFSGTMPWHGPVLGPDGAPAVGALGVLVDEVLGYSLIGSLPSGSWTVSTEIWLDVVGPMPEVDEPLVASADTVQTGSFAVGDVRGRGGRLIAVTRERGRQVPAGPASGVTRRLPSVDRSGSSLAQALGADAVEPGLVVVEPFAGLANPLGVMHGGISLAASELAATAERQAAGSDLRTTSVHIAQVRGVAVDEPFEVRVESLHRGRSLWVSEVRGYTAGRLGTIARVTAE